MRLKKNETNNKKDGVAAGAGARTGDNRVKNVG